MAMAPVANGSAYPENPPTEDAPLRRTIVHAKYGVELCEVEYWVDEDGGHVVRAIDFDLLAVGEDEEDAIDKFVAEAYSLMFAIAELVNTGQATSHEHDIFARLARPIIEVLRRDQEAEARRRTRLIDIQFPRLRRRGDQHGDWSPRSSLGKSNQPSIA